MTARYQTDEREAREAAAFQLVGAVDVLLRIATRDELGNVVITLSEGVLGHIVDTFNRATANDPISADDVGR